MAFPEQFTGITVYGLYNDQTGTTLYGVAGSAASTSGVIVGGTDNLGNFQTLSQTTNGFLNVNATITGGLTNNNAAPGIENLGVLPAIAATSYTTETYTNGNQVLLVTDLHGAINSDLQAVAGVQLGSTAVTAFGTAPAAANVPGVNASLFSGTTGLTNTAGALNVNVTGITFPSSQVVVGNKSNNAVAPGSTNLGVLPGIANAATQTWTEGDQVLESMDLSGRQRVRGTLTNNNAAPAADQLSVMPAVANASAPTWTEGDQVLLSEDLAGNLRVKGTFSGALTNNNAAPTATLLGVLPAIAETAYATVTYTTGDMVLPVTDLHGALNQDLQAIGGAVVVSSAAGVQEVGIVGNTGATLDATVAAGTAPTNALGSLVQYKATIPALTTNQTINQQADTTGATYVNTEGRKATYSASANFTGAAGVIAVLPGSASTTIRVLRVEVSIYTTGTAAIEVLSLIKTSSAPSGGTSSAMSIAPHDSNNAAVSAAPLSFTVAPTVGTAVATVRSVAFADSTAAIPPGANTWLWDWGMRPGQAVVLRGTAQTLEVNLGGAVATQTCIVSFEWSEE